MEACRWCEVGVRVAPCNPLHFSSPQTFPHLDSFLSIFLTVSKMFSQFLLSPLSSLRRCEPAAKTRLQTLHTRRSNATGDARWRWLPTSRFVTTRGDVLDLKFFFFFTPPEKIKCTPKPSTIPTPLAAQSVARPLPFPSPFCIFDISTLLLYRL